MKKRKPNVRKWKRRDGLIIAAVKTINGGSIKIKDKNEERIDRLIKCVVNGYKRKNRGFYK